MDVKYLPAAVLGLAMGVFFMIALGISEAIAWAFDRSHPGR
ncbi:MAG: hypothetical protein ABW075_12625 [Aeromicrobium sp.]